MTFTPELQVLSPQQLELWGELGAVPSTFVLYGGTAIALRLGHRRSIDFDFFRSEPFTPDDLARKIPLLAGAERLQSAPNTLTVVVERGGPVQLSFFGGLVLGRVGEPDQAAESGVWVASKLDLAAMKMAVVMQRAEKKDYLDIEALIRSGVSLENALGAAKTVYDREFNAAITLKALAFFQDGDLPELPEGTQQFLLQKATSVGSIPSIPRISDTLSAAGH